MKFENTEVWGFDHALRGMRNPMNSWDKSDSVNCAKCSVDTVDSCCYVKPYYQCYGSQKFIIGENDMKLAQKLIKAGNEHRKFMRQIFVSVDITAPLYWWKEFDTYKVGTVANSTSTMHKIMSEEFTPDMFEIEGLRGYKRTVKHKVVEPSNNEIWRQYPYGNLYEISNYGRVKRKEYKTTNNHILPEIILKWQYSNDGYAYVGVNTEKTGGKLKNRRVHVLVAETFLDNPMLLPQVNHIDGNKLNNTVSNLEWVTAKDNCQDRATNNLQPHKTYTYKGKLPKEIREEILFRLNTENISRRQIAKEYNVSHTTINSLVNGDYDYGEHYVNEYEEFLKLIDQLNLLRDEYIETKDKEVWKSLIIMLPESWLQTRTITMNYENIFNMIKQRSNHKLNEWSGKDNPDLPNFISWAKTLPYANELLFISQEEDN